MYVSPSQGPPPPKALPTVTTCEVCKGIAFLLDSLVKNNVSKVTLDVYWGRGRWRCVLVCHRDLE